MPSIQLKNSSLLILEKCFLMISSFIVGVIMARLSGKVIYGEFSYILSIVSLFAPLCIMGLNNITTKYVVKRPSNSHFYVQSILLVRGCGAFISVVVGVAFTHLSDAASQYQQEILLLLAFQLFQFLYVFEFYFLAKNNVLPSLLIRLSSFSLCTIIKLIVIFYDLGLLLLIAAHGLHYALSAFGYSYLYYHQRAHLIKKKTANLKSSVLVFHQGKWLLLAGLAALIYLKIDQIMLGHFYNMEEVAIYSAAVRLSEFWYVFPVLIANAFYPKMLKKHKKNTEDFERFIGKMLSLLFGFALVLSLTTALISGWFVKTIYGEAYSESAQILSIHIFATCFIFQRAFYSKWLISNNLLKHSLYSQGLGASLNIILNLVLIPKFGGIGAAWATVIAYITASYFSLFISKKTRPFAIIMTHAMLTFPSVINSVIMKRLRL
ncbi:flippase [Pseudoalteromonas aurantia]|nr:flippase [Pseudoalteromonas aurantia]